MNQESQAAQLTSLIQKAIEGDCQAEAALIQSIYDELRASARRMVGHQQGSVEATDLVDRAWMKIFHDVRPVFRNRQAFFAYMARALRNLLVDHLRRKTLDGERVQLDAIVNEYESQARIDMLSLNEALEALRRENERQFRTVELRFFGGMRMKEIADYLGVGLATTERDWALARAKLRLRLETHFAMDK